MILSGNNKCAGGDTCSTATFQHAWRKGNVWKSEM